MILVRWLARTWSALSAPPPAPLPGPRALPSYARMGRYIAGGVVLDPRIDLLVRQLAAELSGCRWCIEHGLHRWRQAFLPVAELGALRRYAASPLFSARGTGARALARFGPARRLDPAVVVHAALGGGPDRRTQQGQLPAVRRTPIGRGAGQDLTNGHLRWDRPERRPLVAEPLKRGAQGRLSPLLGLEQHDAGQNVVSRIEQVAGDEARDVADDGHEAFFCVVGRLLHRTQPHPVTPDHSVHEPPFLFSWCGRVAGEAQISRPRAREAAVFPCDPTHAQATEPATKPGPPRYRSWVWAQETEACADEKDHRVRLAARVFPVKRREPPLGCVQPSTMMRYFELAQNFAGSAILTPRPLIFPS